MNSYKIITGDPENGDSKQEFRVILSIRFGKFPFDQLERYLDGLGLSHGTLVIFDRRTDAIPPAERTALSVPATAKRYAVRLLRA